MQSLYFTALDYACSSGRRYRLRGRIIQAIDCPNISSFRDGLFQVNVKKTNKLFQFQAIEADFLMRKNTLFIVKPLGKMFECLVKEKTGVNSD